MKIRTGFVSNSSTSSFCLYGLQIDQSQLEEILKTEENETTIHELGGNELGIDCHFPGEDSSCYIGVEYTKLGEDQTKRQFKAEVEGKLAQLFGDKWEEVKKAGSLGDHSGEYYS